MFPVLRGFTAEVIPDRVIYLWAWFHRWNPVPYCLN